MFAALALPAPLRVRLTALRWRVRLLRLVCGFATLVLVLGASAAAAMLVDCFFDLPTLARQIILSTWLVLAIAWLLRGVFVPLCRRLDATALAAAIEEKYPELGERLSSAVELARASVEGHGSPVLIALLLEETAVRSEHLNFGSAAPWRRAAVLAALASATVFLTAAAVVYSPQHSSRMAQRFLRPWSDSPAEARARIAAPHKTAPVLPIELAADSPTITIIPPAYARSVREEQTLHGLGDLTPLQYSEICFDFRFTRPAVAAYLAWFPSLHGREHWGAKEEILELYPLRLSEDRQAAALTIQAIAEGKYHLILEAEADTRTELTGGSVHVQLDRPPSLRRFSGKEYLRGVLPDERIPFEIEAADDIGVAGIELEYRINDGEVVRQPLEMEVGNTTCVLARHVLKLAGKVHEGDRLSYRFHIRDNLPTEYKGPHVLVYPPDRWRTERIARGGESLREQEIRARRDAIDRRLQEIRKALLAEKQGVAQVLQEAPSQKPFPADCLDRIQQLQRENRSNQKALGEMAQLAEAPTGETPVANLPSETLALPLQPVADLAREVADQEMYKSQQALDRAPQEEAPTEQARRLEATDQQLGSAVKRLDELKNMNQQLAQEQLDRLKLEMLAEREKQLAEKTAELAAKHPTLDATQSEQAQKIKDEQAEVAGELERLAQRNELLKQALEQARAEQAQQLADRALELAQSQRNLTQAQTETERKQRADRLSALFRKQDQLAKQQEELSRRTRSSADQLAPLNPENSHRAAEDLRQGEAAEAIRHQEQAANELDRLAQALDQTAKSAADTKAETARTQQRKEQSEQARQLAGRQRELRDAVQRAAQKPGNERSVIGEDPVQELFRKEMELAKRIGELARTIGKDQGEKAEITQQAQEAGRMAVETAHQIQTGTLSEARQEGEKTAEQLNQLAAQLAQTPSRNNWQDFDPLLMPHVLRRQQLDINRRLQSLEGNTRALHAHQRTQQQYLQQVAGELSANFQRLSQEAQSSPPMQSALQKAAANSQQAQQAMQQAGDQGRRDEESAEKQSQERAAQLLEQASQVASDAARSEATSANEGRAPRLDRSKASEAAVRAGQQMAQAQAQLSRGQAAQAQAAMAKAARALAQTVQHMATPPTVVQRSQEVPGQPLTNGGQGSGLPDLGADGKDNPVHLGKSWGELPAALRTKIVQDMKERYGEDYARMIKSYFEQIADTKKR